LFRPTNADEAVFVHEPARESGTLAEITLVDRVAIVTGAGTGLGRAHALGLAGRGAAVVVNDTGANVYGRGSSRAADVVVEEIEAKGGRAVANYDSIAFKAGAVATVDQAIEAFGRVDVVVANAGIQRNNSYEDYDEQDMHDILDVHLKGSFWVTQAAYRIMKQRHYGRVVFTTSTSGLFGRPDSPGYNAAKAGVIGLMNSLAIEGSAYNVLANAVAPVAYTRMNADYFSEVASQLPPEFVTDLVIYLASEQCTITHEVIGAGAGRYARIFIGRGTGWQLDPDNPRSPELIAEHLDEVRTLTNFVVPTTAGADLEGTVIKPD
jgi:NAD(P)-dependent dehydrogenase (short-subunit alcohol dehydrogenase family)